MVQGSKVGERSTVKWTLAYVSWKVFTRVKQGYWGHALCRGL